VRQLKLLFHIMLFISLSANAQSFNTFVESLVNQTNLDSLVKNVRFLSGEDSVFIDGTKTIIKNRNRFLDNELSGRFIKQKLEKYNLQAQEQDFSSTGKNIFAIQEGKTFPDSYYIICAHYDAVTSYAADDNASGTALVLEAARLFQNHQPDYSVIYMLFDDEEIGLLGSEHYAYRAHLNNIDIRGVLNFDMIAWDGDNDNELEIHTSYDGQSNLLAEYILEIDKIYDLPTQLYTINPGTNRSDHAPFWNFNFPAVLFIEELYGSDFNPNYHTNLDRISSFNLSYFHNVSKLGIAVLSSLAFNEMATSAEKIVTIPQTYQLTNYPNPFNPTTTINYQIPSDGYINLVVYDMLGRELEVIESGFKKAGSYNFLFNAENYSSGTYFYSITTSQGTLTKKMLLIK
jgi:hypothetical protein